jgi:hypothetical protein
VTAAEQQDTGHRRPRNPATSVRLPPR